MIRPATVLALVILLSGCATGRPGVDEVDFVAVPQNCELGNVRLVRDQTDARRLYLSQPIDAAPPEPGRIACLTHWASENGLILVLPSDWPR